MMEYPAEWTCKVTELRFEAYLLRTLPRGEALAMAEHLEACAECAQWLTLTEERGLPIGDPRE